MQKMPSYFPLKCVSSVKEEKAHKASYTNGFKELADAKSKNVYPLFLRKVEKRVPPIFTKNSIKIVI